MVAESSVTRFAIDLIIYRGLGCLIQLLDYCVQRWPIDFVLKRPGSTVSLLYEGHRTADLTGEC
jgi:hypothetical protein